MARFVLLDSNDWEDCSPAAYGINAGLLFKPSILNISKSSLRSLFGVVRSLSPSKIEFAPARKHKAWSANEKFILPADYRTTVLGIRILAVATHRAISSPVGAS